MTDKLIAFDNSTICPKCNNKMWFSRKQRIFFHWEHLLNRNAGIVTEIRCKFCGATYDKFKGVYIDESVKVSE